MSITTVSLTHGSGSGLGQLLREVILPALRGDTGAVLEDAALVSVPPGTLAFTTDSFVVSPLEFPGGNIGKLAACGTINDLAMMGARPSKLAVALILEEGLECALLTRLLTTLRNECLAAGVEIVCGDTKVVERGKADGVFITTTGIGFVPPDRSLSAAHARPGDAVLVSGGIGLHGITILAQRESLGFASQAVSDCAALNGLVEALLVAAPATRVLRDATRGGVAAVLNEIADASQVTIRVDQSAVPVPAVVAGACALLGFDPLAVANEGRCVAVVPADQVQAALGALRSHPLGVDGACIGQVEPRSRFGVLLQTAIGGVRPLEVPPGRLLPRIC